MLRIPGSCIKLCHKCALCALEINSPEMRKVHPKHLLRASTVRQCVLEHIVGEISTSTPPARLWPRPLRPPRGRLLYLLFHFHVESPTQTQSKQETGLQCFHRRVKTENEVCCFVKFLGFTGVWEIKYRVIQFGKCNYWGKIST